MNPLLSEAEESRVAEARDAVTSSLAPAVSAMESTGTCPRALLADLSAMAGTSTDLTGLVLAIEEIGRVNAAAATVVGANAVAASVVDRADGLLALALGRPAISSDGNDGLTVSGDLGLVAGGAYAASFVVAADDGALLLACAPGDGCAVESPTDLLGLRGSGHARVSLAAAHATRLDAACGDLLDELRVVQAARAVGLAQGALDAALDEVTRQRRDGQRIDRSQAVQWMLADIATATEAARVATYHAASQPAGSARSETAAMSRLLAAEAAVAASRRALQIVGEPGAVRGVAVERIYRDAKLMEIEGGSNEEQLRDVAALLLPELPAV